MTNDAAKLAEEALPKLPKPEAMVLCKGTERGLSFTYWRDAGKPYFTADQMRAYALAALAQREAAAPVAPAGFVVVPVEPTISMCLAGAAARISVECPTPAEAAYAAMLKAAPQAPASLPAKFEAVPLEPPFEDFVEVRPASQPVGEALTDEQIDALTPQPVTRGVFGPLFNRHQIRATVRAALATPQPQQPADERELPPLPDRVVIDRHLPTGVLIRGYTAEQMRAYARAALQGDKP